MQKEPYFDRIKVSLFFHNCNYIHNFFSFIHQNEIFFIIIKIRNPKDKKKIREDVKVVAFIYGKKIQKSQNKGKEVELKLVEELIVKLVDSKVVGIIKIEGIKEDYIFIINKYLGKKEQNFLRGRF